MITRNVPRDISAYESKLMLGLTARQVCLAAPGIALGVGVYFLVKDSVGDLALFFAMIAAAPFLLFAAFKPLGLPLEVFLKTVMLPMMLAPANRRYKTENTFSKLFLEIGQPVPERDEKTGKMISPHTNKKKKKSSMPSKKYHEV